jgi:hypothetical protein
VAEATPQDNRLNVFISYSRDDLAFSDQLEAALELTFDTTLDRHGISGGEDWKRRLGNLIRDADTVVFVLSPSSAGSAIRDLRLGGRGGDPTWQAHHSGAEPPAGRRHPTASACPSSSTRSRDHRVRVGTGLVRLVTALK